MSNNVSVSFKVAGGDLANYIDSIQKKSDALTNNAIKSAIDQTNKAKEQLKIINETIAALERKSRIESQAQRSLILEQRQSSLGNIEDKYEARKNKVFADNTLTEAQKKERITALTGSEAAESQKIKNDYRENLTVLKEQERQTKIQTTLAKENIDTLRQTARDNVKAITNGDAKLGDIISKASTDEEKLVAKLTEEELAQQKKKEEKSGPGVLGSLLAVDNINKLISTAGQFTSTQNGFDLIKPAGNMLGRVLGGIIGGAIGSIVEPGGGTVIGAGIGASIGGGIGDVIGELKQRQAIAEQNFERAAFRYRGITGQQYGDTDLPMMSGVGVNVTTFLQQQSEYARRRGYASGSAETTRDAIYAEKGFGVDTGTSAALIEMQRSSKESNRDLAGLIGAVIEKGRGNIFQNGDNTFLNEFLSKFTSLQKELLKTSESVPTGLTMDILTKFNSVGGMFSARDPRSAGLISSIQGSLSNPGSDNVKALAYRILSEQNPNASVFDLREMMQQGYRSPGYLKGVLQYIERSGNNDNDRLQNLSGVFSGIPLAAVRRLYNNRAGLMSGNLSVEDLQAKFPTDFKGAAEANTAQLDKNQASIDNALLQGAYKSIEEMADAFKSAIEKSLSGAVIELNEGRGTIRLLSLGTIKKNKTKAEQEASKNIAPMDAMSAAMLGQTK